MIILKNEQNSTTRTIFKKKKTLIIVELSVPNILVKTTLV